MYSRSGQESAADDSADQQQPRLAKPGKIRILYTISSIRARRESLSRCSTLL